MMTRNDSAIAMMTFWLFFTDRFSARAVAPPSWGLGRLGARLRPAPPVSSAKGSVSASRRPTST